MKGFWRFIETRASRRAVLAEWKHVAGPHFPAIKPLLMPTDQSAESYPALNTRMHQPRVVDYGDGTLAAVCSRDADLRVALSAGDIVLYSLDLHALRKTLCGALAGLAIAKTPIDAAEPTIHLGNWEPKKAATFPVHLLLCRQRAELQREILVTAADGRKPGAILLTPTRANWDDQLDALARERRRLLVPLCEVLAVSDGGLTETAAWEEYLEGFCQMVKLTLPGNYRNKKPVPRRAELAAKVEQVKHALVEYIRSARDHAIARIDAGDGPRRLKFLTKSDLAKLAGLKPFHITRCFEADPQLDQLYGIANDPEQMLKYRGR